MYLNAYYDVFQILITVGDAAIHFAAVGGFTTVIRRYNLNNI